jgi:hypothetical protein
LAVYGTCPRGLALSSQTVPLKTLALPPPFPVEMTATVPAGEVNRMLRLPFCVWAMKVLRLRS